jgi:hypothetical protein
MPLRAIAARLHAASITISSGQAKKARLAAGLFIHQKSR